MSKKICILTQSHLCRNPRVVKEANALSVAGYEVTILTTFTYANLLEEDKKLINTEKIKYKGIINLIQGKSSGLYIFLQRLIRRIAGEMIARLHFENVYALGYDYPENLKAARCEKADLYICHQEVSTVIGCKLIKKGFRVAFDFEDWYSHDLLPEANRTRPIRLLEKYEKFALQNAAFSFTTSASLSHALATFGNSEPPKVLNNVFPFSERSYIDNQHLDRNNFSIPSIHWYSQTIGPGRGLELLVKSLSEISSPIQLHLRGNIFGNFRTELENMFPFSKGHLLFFHSLVPHNELLSRIAEHDIGLATEEKTPDSRNLTITNKILQYLLAGIAVIASNTDGQTEVAKEAKNSVFVYINNDSQSLSSTINLLINNNELLTKAKTEALKIAQEKYCWEKQEQLLINWVKQAIEANI